MGICLMILQFTPFTIIYEEGVPGEGARFVMIVPEGGWQGDRE
jgi:hypothetical protein